MNETKELLDTRGEDYGRAWYLESLVFNLLTDYHTNNRELNMYYSEYQGPWRAIMAKMLRLAESPEHVDTWRDIEGYARLARRHIEDGVWHGEDEEEEPESRYTGQMTATFSSLCVSDSDTFLGADFGTIPAWDSVEGDIEVPYVKYTGTLESDGEGGLKVTGLKRAEEELQHLKVAKGHSDEIVLGRATESVEAGDLVVVARKDMVADERE